MPPQSDVHPPLLPLAFSAAVIASCVAFSVDAESLESIENQKQMSGMASSVAPYEPPSLAPSAIVLHAVPAYRVEQGMVKFFFAPSKADVPAHTERALHDIATAVKAGQRVQISGFHDNTGNPKVNTELAKKRAQRLYQRLRDMGAPAAAIELKKPTVAADAGTNHAEARRVEVVLIN